MQCSVCVSQDNVDGFESITYTVFDPQYSLVSLSRSRMVSLGGPVGFSGSRIRRILMCLNLHIQNRL